MYMQFAYMHVHVHVHVIIIVILNVHCNAVCVPDWVQHKLVQIYYDK